MPWSNQAISLIVLDAAATGFSGLFVYSPVIGFGNLIASVAADAATDPSGNPYKAGVVSYGTGSSLSQLLGAMLNLADTSGNTWAFQAMLVSGTPYLAYVSPIGDNAFFNELGNIQGSNNANQPEVWNTLPLNGPGFVAGATLPRYRYEPIGTQGIVRLVGQVKLGGTEAAGSVIATLPVGYRPATEHAFLTPNNLSGATGSITGAIGGSILVTSTGQVEIVPNGVSGNVVWLDGITFPLD